MNKNGLISQRLLILMMVCIIMGSLIASCIKNEDEEDSPALPIPVIPDSIANDSMQIITEIDSLFQAKASELHGEWMAQYEGYDLRQRKLSSIRRLVFLSPEGFYDSHVQGIVDIQDTITSYKEFEHEHGSYIFDESKQIVRYKIDYDSLLNFKTDRLEFNSGKMKPGIGFITEYEEKIWFSKEGDGGQRFWIRVDDSLVSPDDYKENIVYVMINQK